MKTRIGIIIVLLCALCFGLAMADDAYTPPYIQDVLQPEMTDCFAIADYMDLPADGWAFALLQNETGLNRLVIFRQSNDGTWSRWLATEKAIPQGTNKVELLVDSSGSPHAVYPESQPVYSPVFQVIQYKAPEGDPALAYPERKVEFALTDGKWLLTWWEDDQY